MSGVADSTELSANENTEQIKLAPEIVGEVKSEGEDAQVKDEITEDAADNKNDAVKETDIKHNGDAADAKDEDHDHERDGASPDHKRKRAHDADNADYPKRKKFGNDRKNNIKSTFDMEESNDHAEIRRQVEFYFSDSNLPIDKYLLGLTGGHENKPVELRIIHNFKRMKHFQPFSEIANAVRASNFLDLNEKDEITRKTPLASKFGDDIEENKKLLHTDSMANSIYAKGFGEEKHNTHTDIESFFSTYGPIKSVRLRRDPHNFFKGSVFVEFATPELQQKFLDLDPKPQWEIDENEMVDLKVMSKQEYFDTKHEGILDGLVRPRSPRGFRGGRGGPPRDQRDSRGRGRGARGSRGGRGNDRRHDRRDGRGRDNRRGRDRHYNDDDDDKSRSRSYSRSASRSRSRSRSPARRPSRKESRESYNGSKDNWRERRDHDQEEDRKESRRSGRGHRGEGKRNKRDRDEDHNEQGDVKRSKRDAQLESEAKAVDAGAAQEE